MEWYYAEGPLKVGPVSEEELESRLAKGVITRTTLVWHEGMENWKPLRDLRPDATRATARDRTVEKAPARRTCAWCKKAFPADEVIRLGGNWVCAACKPVYFQMLKEGAEARGTFRYGGFWIRGVALFLDGLILGIPMFIVSALIGYALFARGAAPNRPPDLGYLQGANALVWIGFVALTVWFWGKFGATPGKMICGLRIVRPNGERISYARALGRYLAQLLSYVILYIGFIMAAFDSEKRALHDRVCDTRVIKTR